MSTTNTNPRAAFIKAATWHGDLQEAEAILTAHPELRSGDIHTAAILGDDAAVRRFLSQDPKNAIAKSEPYGGDALTYLCLSKYFRLDKSRSDSFLRAATALLDAGADAKTGFWTTGQHREFETALYGAAGVAHHAAMTRLLVERGANPNDIEAVYHSPETHDLDALKVLVETGKLTADSLAIMLIRKHDWHDFYGVKYLLEHGADANYHSRWDFSALHHAIHRDNCIEIVKLLLDHGADPAKECLGRSATAAAARRGRGDVLKLFEQRGFHIELSGVERLIAVCARCDATIARSIAQEVPHLVSELLAQGGALLAEFAGNDNTEGVRILLDLGVPVTTLYAGDGYFGIAKDSTALHVAAWKSCPDTVRLLIERGAPANAKDGKGQTPLALAVKACVDSYWTEYRTPESVKALLAAGATLDGVKYPSGYDEVDTLLRAHGTGAEE